MPDHDLIFTGEISPLGKNPIWELFVSLWTQVEVPDIVPGQPLPVRWRVINATPDRGEMYSVRIKVDGILVYTRDNVPASSASSSMFGTGGFQTETLSIGDNSIARAVYRVGRRKLQVEVQSSLGTVVAGQKRFRVHPEPVNSSWWEWTTPPFQSLEWKSGYSLTGRFVNHCKFASLALTSLEFCEVRSEDEPGINPCDYNPVLVSTVTDLPAGASSPVSFARLHDWKWINAHPYLVHGPLNKTFACAIWFVCTDEFGNVYRGQCTSRRIRHVGVSKKKRFAAVGMQTAVANAAFWAATIFGWPIAVGWYAAAAGLAEAAKDPPAPDPAFRSPVVVHRNIPQRLKLPGGTAPTDTTDRLLDTVAEILALEAARTVARSRILGATHTGDDAAAEDRRGEFLELSRRLEQAASDLESVVDPFVEEIEATEGLRPADVSATLASFVAEGLPREIREQMVAAGVPMGTLLGIDAAVREADISEIAAANGIFTRSFIAAVMQFAREGVAEVDMVLAGEEYVHVEQEIDDWEESGEGRDVQRRSNKSCC